MIHAAKITTRRFEVMNRIAGAEFDDIARGQQPDAIVRFFALMEQSAAIAAEF